jgi:hypothetical protein
MRYKANILQKSTKTPAKANINMYAPNQDSITIATSRISRAL